MKFLLNANVAFFFLLIVIYTNKFLIDLKKTIISVSELENFYKYNKKIN